MRAMGEADHEWFFNPSLAKLLSVLDEAHERLRESDLEENC
jgi:hypothetical protein